MDHVVCRHFSFGWTDLSRQLMHISRCRDLSVRQFHSASFLDLLELREKLGGKVDIDAQLRAETQHLGDCCVLTFFELGL